MAKTAPPPPKIKGFTLVELSIVIVVIGLVVGAVTTGMSLVKQARLRAVITDVGKYKVAMNAFRLQYNTIPGDMGNASSYWPACDPNCNGNGNRVVEWSWEAMGVFQHLSLARLIEGNYTGSGGTPKIGTTIPPGPIPGSAYTLYGSTPSNNPFYLSSGRFLGVGSPLGTLLTPTDASSIDIKYDDGLATKGRITSGGGHNGSGWSANCISGDTYLLSVTTSECILIFLDVKL
jgi:prepilin-type N-terminal cleavage/methylation domain-containing protein